MPGWVVVIETSAEGATLCKKIKSLPLFYIGICAAPSVLILILFPYPGLTAGPIDCRPFGPAAGVACVVIWNAHAGFAQASTSTFCIQHSAFDILFSSG